MKILKLENLNTESIRVSTNLILWKNNARNVTDLPILTYYQMKNDVVKKNLLYNNSSTMLLDLEMSDSGNFINEILKSIEFDGKYCFNSIKANFKLFVMILRKKKIWINFS